MLSSAPSSPDILDCTPDNGHARVLLAERQAAALARGLSLSKNASDEWEPLVAAARGCLLTYALEEGCVTRFYDVENARDAVAACRILDAAAQFAPQLSPNEARQSGLVASLAFGACGNFPSASVVARRTFPTLVPRSQAAALELLAAAPVLAEQIEICEAWTSALKYLRALQTFLAHGDDASKHAMFAAWKKSEPLIEDPLQRALASLCVEHAQVLGTARALRGGWIDKSGALKKMLEDGLSLLLPPQREALAVRRVHEAHGNAVIALPPGTGKTLLGEACALESLRDGGWACFLVPYVALGRQVSAALERHAGSGVRVHRLLGGEGSFPLEDEASAVVVATPERLDALLRRSPEAALRLRAVVCDEAHGVGDAARGVRLEGLLSRLRLMQKREAYDLRLILLSASVRRPRALQAWIEAPEERVVASKWCATARRLAIWNLDGSIEWHTGSGNPTRRVLEAQASKYLRAGEQAIGDMALPEADIEPPQVLTWPSEFGRSHLAPRARGLRATDSWVAVQKGEESVRANIAGLVAHLHEHFGGAILAVCATKKNARQLAVALASELPAQPVGINTQRAIDLIGKHFGFLKPLSRTLERGAAWHHAGLPHAVREAIEAAIKSGEISVVAATTTLAEGVDFPFRWTILVDWLGWSEAGRAPLSRWLLRNIVGRCGRAGAWTEGDTLVYENPLGDRAFTESPQRRRWIEHLCLEPGPAEARSALEAITSSPPTWAVAALETQFLAALGENEWHSVEEAVEQFAVSLYATHRKVDVRPLLRAALEDWIQAEEPLLQEGEMLELTLVGEAFRASDLSPSTARRLLQVLRGDALRWRKSASEVGALLASELGDVPEQSHESWRKVASRARNRFPLKRDDVGPILQAWLHGEAPEEVFALLPSTQLSTRTPRFEDWLDGGGMDEGATLSDWYADLDRWAEWLRAVPETFLPFVLRACEALSDLAPASEKQRPWALWAEMFEAGVDSERALRWKSSGAPGTRKVLCTLSEVLGDSVRPSRAALEAALAKAQKLLGGAHSPDGRSLEGFAHWRGLSAPGEGRLAA